MAFRVVVNGVPVECDTAEEAMALAGWKGERPAAEPSPSTRPRSDMEPWRRALAQRDAERAAKQKGHAKDPVTGKLRRGFACMDRALVRAIAQKGGKKAHELGLAHEFTPEEGRVAGSKGGRTTAQNRQHMATIGRAGDLAKGALSGALDCPVGESSSSGADQDSSPNGRAEDDHGREPEGHTDGDGGLSGGDGN